MWMPGHGFVNKILQMVLACNNHPNKNVRILSLSWYVKKRINIVLKSESEYVKV
jgi:hypothetical protein